MVQTKAVRDSINLDIVFWDEYGQDYHLFKNCSNVSGNTESTVEQSFEQNKKQLCEGCKNNVAKYKEYRKNARDYYNSAIDLQDEKYYNRAFEYCDSLLMMRPDNKRINDIKQEIETRRK
ncbi:MAG: hypothetical protein LBT04_06605 [Prevotellaceae bacterium]|jgi:predicted Zn-dependent protease|nr:hypothetical protein [Prevotellaceae bacterium]